MTSRRFRSRWTPAAIVLDAIAAVGLVLVALGAFLRSDAFVLVAAGAVLGLAALPGAVVSAGAFVQETGARGLARRVAVPVAVVLCGCAVAAGPAGLALGWALTPNPAADQSAAVLHDLRARGAVRLCEAGDAGRGPDNFSAWQTGFYRMPAERATPAAMRRLFAAHGHALVQRPAEGSPDPHGTYLTTDARGRAARSLSVEISRGPVDLQCTMDGVYGRTWTPAPGERLLVVSSDAPPW